MATIHLSKGAPKSTRLDVAAIRKRASIKGDLVAEVKAGERANSVNIGWMIERYLKKVVSEQVRGPASTAKGNAAKKSPTTAKKTMPAKRTAVKKTGKKSKTGAKKKKIK